MQKAIILCKMIDMKKRKKRKHTTLKMKPAEWAACGVLLIAALLLLVIFKSQPTLYEVAVFNDQNQKETVQYYHQYEQAQSAMNSILESGNENAAILVDDEIINIRYGIVNFRTKACRENTSFTMDETNQTGYTNGCYGADALFLGRSDDLKKIKFKQSGVIGWVSANDVEILGVNDPKIASLSVYQSREGGMHHLITTDLTRNHAAAVQIGDPGIPYQNQDLYSYDGHYFYSSFSSMADDERNQSHAHALNPNQPYYNFYQFLSHRALSNYTASDINWYVANYLGYTGTPSGSAAANSQSLLYQEGTAFIRYQNQYGTNALMMFSLAINESAFGRSELALKTNNLFSHAAFDIDPDGNATRYKSASASIHAHAKIFLSNGYLDPCDQSIKTDDPLACRDANGNRYYGGFFGDKSGGMNVRYASDPYWGEKAAAHYRGFDETMGGSDRNIALIGIMDGRKSWGVYQKPDPASPLLYYTPNTENYAVILLEKVKGAYYENSDEWYRIQSDAVLNKDRTAVKHDSGVYDSQHNIAYIPASALKEVIGK